MVEAAVVPDDGNTDGFEPVAGHLEEGLFLGILEVDDGGARHARGSHEDAADVLGQIAFEGDLSRLEGSLDHYGRGIRVGTGGEAFGAECVERFEEGTDRAGADRGVARKHGPAGEGCRDRRHEIQHGTGIADIDNPGGKPYSVRRRGDGPHARFDADIRPEGTDHVEAGQTVRTGQGIPDGRRSRGQGGEDARADGVALRAGHGERPGKVLFFGQYFHLILPAGQYGMLFRGVLLPASSTATKVTRFEKISFSSL